MLISAVILQVTFISLFSRSRNEASRVAASERQQVEQSQRESKPRRPTTPRYSIQVRPASPAT